MIVHAHDESAPIQVQQFDKSFGKNLKTQDVQRVPELFFCHDQKPPSELVKIVVDKIQTIRDVFELQRLETVQDLFLWVGHETTYAFSGPIGHALITLARFWLFLTN